MSELFRVPRFEPRRTPGWMSWFDGVVSVPLAAFWGSGAWLVFQLMRGERLLALGLLPLWLGAVLWAALALHRAGRVRLAVSLTTTGLLLVGAWLMVGDMP